MNRIKHHRDCKLYNAPQDAPERHCKCGVILLKKIGALIKEFGDIRFRQGVKTAHNRGFQQERNTNHDKEKTGSKAE